MPRIKTYRIAQLDVCVAGYTSVRERETEQNRRSRTIFGSTLLFKSRKEKETVVYKKNGHLSL